MKEAILKQEIDRGTGVRRLDFSGHAVRRSSLLGVSFCRPRSPRGEAVRFAERKVLPLGPFDARSARNTIG
jgi:hypothetical protein